MKIAILFVSIYIPLALRFVIEMNQKKKKTKKQICSNNSRKQNERRLNTCNCAFIFREEHPESSSIYVVNKIVNDCHSVIFDGVWVEYWQKKNASYINVIPEQRNKQTKKKNNYDKLLCW